MLILIRNLKILLVTVRYHQVRFLTTRRPSSQEIRRQFVDYFVQNHDHRLVRSSPVVPFCDPTVAFVNAGMNQFKNIFLGTAEPPAPRVANSQKCVRVGGKHNDLSIVGTDGYHHTFFEMLGNWSFGSYFKKEACEYAWNLLQGPYAIDPKRLYITYFGGDKALQLEADFECKDIWRQLGVSEERLIPFGVSDNFWEMAATGPCGPCTEIHIDHLPSTHGSNRAQYVNAGRADLTELWNIVFIQYNRHANGSLSSLPMKHIDTGMGLERLVAILQKSNSNYDTDLFRPIFNHIQRATNAPAYEDTYDLKDPICKLSTAYRVLADHSRMITACLADGMFPDQNHKLRRVIRKTISLSERSFLHSNLLPEVVCVVAESLGNTYPEMSRNLEQIQQIISNEQDLFRSLLASSSSELKDIMRSNPTLEENDVIDFPGFIPAYKELMDTIKPHDRMMSGKLMFKLYDTYGLNEDAIERLGEAGNLALDRTGFAECLAEARRRTKSLFQNASCTATDVLKLLSLPGVAPTENELKYNYKFNYYLHEYVLPEIKAKVVAVEERENGSVSVVLDQSTFYPDSGGQECDRGQLIKSRDGEEDVIFEVDSVNIVQGLVVHDGRMVKGQLATGDTVELIIDAKRRTGNIQNHTATHLINASVRKIVNSVTYQKSSSVSSEFLKIELGILRRKIDKILAQEIEDFVRKIVQSAQPITIDLIDAQQFYAAYDITRIPGEVYPEANIRILNIANESLRFLSREPCCGTHANNTKELEDFCITNVKHTGRGGHVFTAITGKPAKLAHEAGSAILKEIEKLKKEPYSEETKTAAQQYKRMFAKSSHQLLPYTVRLECMDVVNEAVKQLKTSTKVEMDEIVITEMRKELERKPIATNPFLIHVLRCSGLMETVPLQKATKLCTDRPVIIISFSDGSVRARCCVPKRLVSPDFSAEKWLLAFAEPLDGQMATVQKGQNTSEVAMMKGKQLRKEQLEEALKLANIYAQQHLLG